MRSRIAVGIDVGSTSVRVVITEQGGDHAPSRIIGTGYAESKGLRHGYIINEGDAARAVKQAVAQAEEISGVSVRSAFLAVGGVGIDEARGRGEAIIARADNQVSELDIEKAVSMARENAKTRMMNRRVLHTIPLAYTLDGEEVLGRPGGMHGSKIAVEVLFITCLEQHVTDLENAIEAADVAVADVMAAPLSGAIVTATPAEKRAGCVLANIGAETVSIVVFENGVPISVKVFRIGSSDITKDIALGLRVSLEEAEQLKLGAVLGASFPKKKFDDILSTRLTTIFELIDAHLKKLGKDRLLPAGIILAGGGSGIGPIKDIAEEALKLPSKLARLGNVQGGKIKDSSWAVAYGLTIWGLTGESSDTSAMRNAATRMGSGIGKFFKQFLP